MDFYSGFVDWFIPLTMAASVLLHVWLHFYTPVLQTRWWGATWWLFGCCSLQGVDDDAPSSRCWCCRDVNRIYAPSAQIWNIKIWISNLARVRWKSESARSGQSEPAQRQILPVWVSLAEIDVCKTLAWNAPHSPRWHPEAHVHVCVDINV